jgi:hypothetical protein
MIMPGAVDLAYATDISLTADTFSQDGAAGAHFGLGVQDSSITHSTFTGIAGNGIELGDVVDPISHHPDTASETVKDLTVSDNTIASVADEYNDCVGVLATYTDGSVIDHNTNHDLPYSGISVGWGWALVDQQPETGESSKHAGIYENNELPQYSTPTTSANNQITNNLIYNVMTVQHDGGAIYTLGAQSGTTVTGNYVHDVLGQGSADGAGAAAVGLYLDEGSAHLRDTNNVFQHVAGYVFLNISIPTPDDDVTDNYTDSPPGTSPDTSVVHDNSHVAAGTPSAQWPTAAQTVMNNAGARP